jgi:nucleotide-binding universal stress UspA family protein
MTIDTRTATTAGGRAWSSEVIVVAVDGSKRNRSALTWAANEAAATGSDIALVTVVEDHVVSRPHFSVRSEDDHINHMLSATRDEVQGLAPEQPVFTEVVAGSPVAVLLDRADQARMVVVGKRGLGGFSRILVGSTSIAVAGRAKRPVAVVPDGWNQPERDDGPVVVGVDPYRLEEPPLQWAFERARRLGVTLVAVHGWEPPGAYARFAAIKAVAESAAAWEKESEEAFDKVLEVWRDRFPDVDVTVLHARTHPATALLDAAEQAQLLGLGRRADGLLGGFPLGSVTRAVLHYSECPVVVVPSTES